MIHWIDPDENGLPVERAITHDEAVARQKVAAARRGYVYDTDTDALDDFMTIHWAWEKE